MLIGSYRKTVNHSYYAGSTIMKSMYYWLGKHVHAPYGTFIFSLLIFIEGFFFVPVSTLLAFYCLENRRKCFIYALIATCISGLGALVGYYLGTLLWQAAGTSLIHFFISPEKFTYLVEQYKTHQAWAVFIVALTPIPFKALTLTAGFCHLPVVPFVLFSIVARGIKFYSIGGAIYLWGDQVQYYLNKYFYYFVTAGIGTFILMWWLLH
jgi:membrane protein YqaA with SNARE-associated domain